MTGHYWPSARQRSSKRCSTFQGTGNSRPGDPEGRFYPPLLGHGYPRDARKGCALGWCQDLVRLLTLRRESPHSGEHVPAADHPGADLPAAPCEERATDGAQECSDEPAGTEDTDAAERSIPRSGKLLHSPAQYGWSEERWRRPTVRLSEEELVKRRVRQKDDSPITRKRRSPL